MFTRAGVVAERAETNGRIVVAGCVVEKLRQCPPRSQCRPTVLLIAAPADRWPCCGCRLLLFWSAKARVAVLKSPSVLLDSA